jgi:magnesium chelatase family protein
VLETLREPLESGASISPAARHAEFPAEFQLIAAMNPALRLSRRAGGKCRCTRTRLRVIAASSPAFPRPHRPDHRSARPAGRALAKADGESSATVRARVEAAEPGSMPASRNPMPAWHPGSRCLLPARCRRRKLLQQATTQLDLSARAWHRILKVARTIADLAASDDIRAPTSPKPSSTGALPVAETAVAAPGHCHPAGRAVGARPFSIDTYLPSFHDIAEKLNATPLEVQQTLSAYLMSFA